MAPGAEKEYPQGLTEVGGVPAGLAVRHSMLRPLPRQLILPVWFGSMRGQGSGIIETACLFNTVNNTQVCGNEVMFIG